MLIFKDDIFYKFLEKSRNIQNYQTWYKSYYNFKIENVKKQYRNIAWFEFNFGGYFFQFKYYNISTY